uniref:B-cell receptor CD22 n=1 Tax=Fundulus heteroclitus TaxID=8078 RepID=A0A3Q2QU32_FUNHE
SESLVVFLNQGSWEVIYTQTQICAVKGSTVDITCSYTYQTRAYSKQTEVLQTLWSKGGVGSPVDLMSDPDYKGRVQYLCDPPVCTLRITDLRESDSAQYKFTFSTNSGASYTELPGVTLSVTGNILLKHNYLIELLLKIRNLSDIVEGSSVTLTCSSDANPAASYTWYKDDITNSPSDNSQLVFSSIQSSDSGRFICMAKNQLGWKWSRYQHLDVKYAPQPPSVSVSPSGEIVEGSSVTLTCSSDANPAASYTWYKEDEESPTASGQNFTITDVRPEHSGRYSCEAQNNRGSQSSTVLLIVIRGSLFLQPELPVVLFFRNRPKYNVGNVDLFFYIVFQSKYIIIYLDSTEFCSMRIEKCLQILQKNNKGSSCCISQEIVTEIATVSSVDHFTMKTLIND